MTPCPSVTIGTRPRVSLSLCRETLRPMNAAPLPSLASTVLARGRRAFVLGTRSDGVRVAAYRVRFIEPRMLRRFDADEELTPIAVYEEDWIGPEDVKPDPGEEEIDLSLELDDELAEVLPPVGRGR